MRILDPGVSTGRRHRLAHRLAPLLAAVLVAGCATEAAAPGAGARDAMAASPGPDAQAARPITILSGDGPDADRLGRPQGYPACVQALVRADCRVGTWSAQHRVAATRLVSPSANPLPLPPMERPPAVSFRWQGETLGVDAYLAQTQATGLIIVKDGRIVLERYRYGRGPDMPMRSFSMAKTVTSMLVGIAHDKGLIRSLDDEAAAYWPQIADSAYGRTTIRNLLRMGSGVTFRELYTRTPEDDNWTWNLVLTAPANRDRPERVVDYLNGRPERSAPQGTRFQYASIETEILGRVLVRATGRSIASLTEAWLWQPMGAQSPARWLFAASDSVESAGGGFNATLRDWARLGVLLANDGRRDGVPVVPRDYLLEATDAARQPEGFRPGRATPGYGYGYQTWLLPMRTRTFALQGIHGQFVFVQPDSGIVMVQTSVFDQPSGRMDPRPYQRINALWRGVLDSLGGDSRAR